jgi:hypothetical protein
VQPRALSIIAHKGIEFVIWRKGNGSLTPAPVIAKPATAGDYWQSPGRS